MNNIEKSVEYFKQGYNCSQAVFAVYAPMFGIDEKTALKLSSSFGGGMGRLREVCGAVTAMFAIAGLAKGTSAVDDITKAKLYSLIQSMAKEFKNEYGTIICRELLKLESPQSSPEPTKRTEDFYKTRPCEYFIKTACEIIERNLSD
ncbi:MAG: C-GCAxxG-C-C family protein [bacterium]|nr:C-GCAxxG-C-C family protein [bacterium]